MCEEMSWSVAIRVPREPYQYSAIGHRAMVPLRQVLLARARDIVHADRWMERHQDWLAGLGAEMAQHVMQDEVEPYFEGEEADTDDLEDPIKGRD